MRVVVDKWIVTTLKQSENRDESTSASDASSTYLFAQDTGLIRRRRRRRRKSESNKTDDLIIEQRVSTQQQLFQAFTNSSEQSLNNDNETKFKKSDKYPKLLNKHNEKEKFISQPFKFSTKVKLQSIN